MKRMVIPLVLSALASLTFNAIAAGQDDICTYSTEMVDTYYEGCFCDYEGTRLCAGSGYMLYIYTCDGPCPNCWNCNYWKDSHDSVLGKLYPVCHSIHAAAPLVRRGLGLWAGILARGYDGRAPLPALVACPSPDGCMICS